LVGNSNQLKGFKADKDIKILKIERPTFIELKED
jgi:hypothetical protein